MKHYKGDIVEIINLQSYSGNFAPTVSHKYYVNKDSENDSVEITSLDCGWVDLHTNNVLLHKRTLINKIKSLFE